MKAVRYIALVALLAVAGCTTSRGKFTRQNYEAIYHTQQQSEVLKIMGKPNHVEADYWEYRHQRPFYKAKVYFADDRVVDRKWWDEDVEQPSPAPTSKPGFGSETSKPEKP